MDWWDKKTKILAMFISHDPLHEIDDYLAEIKGAIILTRSPRAPLWKKRCPQKIICWISINCLFPTFFKQKPIRHYILAF